MSSYWSIVHVIQYVFNSLFYRHGCNFSRYPQQPLPDYPRMKTGLAGKPVADAMMVVEFLNNFGTALNLGNDMTSFLSI